MKLLHKMLLLTSILSTSLMACNNAGGGGGSPAGTNPNLPTSPANPAKKPNNAPENANMSPEELTDKVSGLERQLMAYGVHFNVEHRPNYFNRNSQYHGDRETIHVQLKVTADEADLQALGLKIEDRDSLFKTLCDLADAPGVKQIRSLNDAPQIVLMKTDLVCNQIMVPKLIELYQEVVTLKQQKDFVFARDPELDLSYWASPTLDTLTNSEVFIKAKHLALVHANFEKTKTGFLSRLIDQMVETMSLEDQGPYSKPNIQQEELLKAFREIHSTSLLSEDENKHLLALQSKVKLLPPTQKFSTRILNELNAQILNISRQNLLSRMSEDVQEGMQDLRLAFTADNSIDKKSIAERKVQRSDFYEEWQRTSREISRSQAKYLTFIGKFKDSTVVPSNEQAVLMRAEAFLNIQ